MYVYFTLETTRIRQLPLASFSIRGKIDKFQIQKVLHESRKCRNCEPNHSIEGEDRESLRKNPVISPIKATKSANLKEKPETPFWTFLFVKMSCIHSLSHKTSYINENSRLNEARRNAEMKISVVLNFKTSYSMDGLRLMVRNQLC